MDFLKKNNSGHIPPQPVPKPRPIDMPITSEKEKTKPPLITEYSNYEKERALMEAYLIHAMDGFFTARPHFERTSGTMNCTERLFEAAFIRGWEAKSNQLIEEAISQ